MYSSSSQDSNVPKVNILKLNTKELKKDLEEKKTSKESNEQKKSNTFLDKFEKLKIENKDNDKTKDLKENIKKTEDIICELKKQTPKMNEIFQSLIYSLKLSQEKTPESTIKLDNLLKLNTEDMNSLSHETLKKLKELKEIKNHLIKDFINKKN